MRNDDFQDMVQKGDILITKESIRWKPGEKYKFLKFDYCKHFGSPGCRGCKGSMITEDIQFEKKRSDCGREYNNGKLMDYLVVKMKIIGNTKWLSEEDWEIS